MDLSTSDKFLVAREIYFTNQDLLATPPGQQSGRKVLAGQSNQAENGLYEIGWDEETAAPTWGNRICPTGFLIIRVGDGENVGQNTRSGFFSLDGTGKTWGTDPITITPGVVRRFTSTTQTGDGTEQSIAHGLGVVPGTVIVEIVRLPALAGAATLVGKGAHTTTHCKITALTGLEYIVTAIP